MSRETESTVSGPGSDAENAQLARCVRREVGSISTISTISTISIISISGIGIEMERLAASMGGTIKWPYNDSECLDADFFKVMRIIIVLMLLLFLF